MPNDSMNGKLKARLIEIVKGYSKNNDVSHNMQHTMRVLANAELIGRKESADLDIIIPAALFHDAIVSPKGSAKAKLDGSKCSRIARLELDKAGYPKEKIDQVCYAISLCSYSKGIRPTTLEAKILQDSDRLEATGAISIMRTFASAGSENRLLYDEHDAFAESRKPDDLKYGLDLFYTRLLVVRGKMYTKTARELADGRTRFLREFIKELKREMRPAR